MPVTLDRGWRTLVSRRHVARALFRIFNSAMRRSRLAWRRQVYVDAALASMNRVGPSRLNFWTIESLAPFTLSETAADGCLRAEDVGGLRVERG